MPNIHKSLTSVLRIDDLVITALPGEPTAGLGLALADAIEADALESGQAVRSMTFGYAQDYLLYLIEADDWFGGAHEGNANFFGWRLGPHIAEATRKLAGTLWSKTTLKDADDGRLKPMFWTDLVDDEIPPTPGREAPGEFVTVIPEQFTRGELVTLEWAGGHPGVDQPRIILERQNRAGAYETALRPSGLPYNNHGYESVLRYIGDYEDDHRWQLQWEFDFRQPMETYRFSIEGRAMGDGMTTYSAKTAEFKLRPSTLVVHDAVWLNGRLGIQISYPDGPSSDDGESPFEQLAARGTLLRHDPHQDLPDGALPYAFILGPPVAGPEVSVSYNTIEGEVFTTGEAVRTSIGRDIVTSRSTGGMETTTRIDPWIVGHIDIGANEPPIGAVRVEDRWGNAVEFELPSRD